VQIVLLFQQSVETLLFLGQQQSHSDSSQDVPFRCFSRFGILLLPKEVPEVCLKDAYAKISMIAYRLRGRHPWSFGYTAFKREKIEQLVNEGQPIDYFVQRGGNEPTGVPTPIACGMISRYRIGPGVRFVLAFSSVYFVQSQLNV
jgi:hypothetical protein